MEDTQRSPPGSADGEQRDRLRREDFREDCGEEDQRRGIVLIGWGGKVLAYAWRVLQLFGRKDMHLGGALCLYKVLVYGRSILLPLVDGRIVCVCVLDCYRVALLIRSS
jgi:hypothetical protein